MSDDQTSIDLRRRSWIDKIAQVFSDEPTDTRSLLDLLRNAEQDRLLDADALGIIEGALQVSSMQVRDIMIPRSQAVILTTSMPAREAVEIVAGATHSRFPVIEEDVDNIIGILLAKDLLPMCLKGMPENFNLKKIVRPATFVPESRRVNVLLKEFRERRSHMAIVVDDYGSVSGIVTIEDALEQIVGEIQDETDIEDDSQIKKIDEHSHEVKALTPIGDFNEHFATELDDQEYNTIGGILLQSFGRIPAPGESTRIGPYLITVLDADNRHIQLLKVSRSGNGAGGPDSTNPDGANHESTNPDKLNEEQHS